MEASRDLRGETALAGQPTIAVILPCYNEGRPSRGSSRTSGANLPSFFWAAEGKPWPTVQNDPPVVKFWLGDEDVMNR